MLFGCALNFGLVLGLAELTQAISGASKNDKAGAIASC